MLTRDRALWLSGEVIGPGLMALLKHYLGPPPYNYEWGTIESYYDARGGSSSIVMNYVCALPTSFHSYNGVDMMEVRHEPRGEAKADMGQTVRANGRCRADLPTVRYLQTDTPQMVAAVSSRGHQRAGEPESPAEAHPVPQGHAGGREVDPRLET